MRLFALALLATLLASPALAQTPAQGEVVINEIAYDPPSPQASSNEWVEVVNRSERTVDLTGLVVGDEANLSDAFPGPLLLAPGEFAVFVRNESEFTAAYPGVAFVALEGFPSLNNGGDRVSISIAGVELDAVPYEPSWGGENASLERRDPDGPSTDASNFTTTTDPDGGTPGETNTAFEVDTTPPDLLRAEAETSTLVTATFSEPLDIATAEDESNYSFSDGLGQPVSAEILDDDPALVRLTLATPLPGLGTYTLTASGLADRAGNVMEAQTVSFGFGEGDVPQPRDVVLNEFLYDEPASDNPGEFIELFNRTDGTYDLSEFTLNDSVGDDEPIAESLTLLEPGGYVVIVEDATLFAAQFPGVPFIEQDSWSALNNSGDAIVLKYQGVTIDSLTYTPSWGGEDASLERKDPRGPSSSASNWTTTSDPRGGTPGAINSQFAPDQTGPQALSVQVSASETVLTVTFDEPIEAESVSAGAFSIPGVTITSATPEDDGATVTLQLASRLPSGTYTLTASDLADGLGNVATSSVTFSFEQDDSAPRISTASATTATTVVVTLTEPATNADDATLYSVSDGIGQPAEAEALNATRVLLTFATPLADRTVYTLTATGLRDAAGNVSGASTAILFFGMADMASEGDIAITEIMFDPQTGSDGEYVELLNLTSDGIFDLRDLVLDDALDGDDPLALTPTILAPGQYLAVVEDLDAFRVSFPDAPAVEAASFPGLGNSGDLVALIAGAAVVDSVTYDPDWHRVELEDATGVALERRNPTLDANDPDNWSSSLDQRGGTPGEANSIRTASEPPSGSRELTISPSPFDAGSGQGTTISYTLDAPAALVRVRIFDGAGRQVRELESARLSGSEGALIWNGRDDRGERLRVGPYVVLLEAVDTEGGTTEALKGVVILAREL